MLLKPSCLQDICTSVNTFSMSLKLKVECNYMLLCWKRAPLCAWVFCAHTHTHRGNLCEKINEITLQCVASALFQRCLPVWCAKLSPDVPGAVLGPVLQLHFGGSRKHVVSLCGDLKWAETLTLCCDASMSCLCRGHLFQSHDPA